MRALREDRTGTVRTLAMVAVLAVAACHSSQPAHPAHPTTTGSSGTAGVQLGCATFYNESQTTASGERFDKNAMTAAHRSLPFGTIVRVTNRSNGLSVDVRVNDRGPYGRRGCIIDLSEVAARQLHMIDAGVVQVRLEVMGKR
jgi:rare lipoprotein A